MFIFVMLCLELSSEVLSISVTGDDYVAVFDENGDEIVHSYGWQSVVVADLENPCVIAVNARDLAGGASGVIANTSLGHVTDETWKCSGEYEDYWYKFMFNDSHWDDAVLQSKCVSI